MAADSKQPSDNQRDQILAEARHREQSYRERALKLFPWVCGRCGRELSGKELRELTVHHRDHNHDNNSPDGSHWELLCLYCHDNEHSRLQDAQWYGEEAPRGASGLRSPSGRLPGWSACCATRGSGHAAPRRCPQQE